MTQQSYFKLIKNLEAQLQKEPYQLHLYYHLAQLYQMIGQSNLASGILQKLLKLKPNLAETHYHLSQLYYQNRQLSLAKSYLNQSLKLEPENIQALNLSAIICLSEGDVERSYRLFEQLLAALPPSQFQTNTVSNAIFCVYALPLLYQKDKFTKIKSLISRYYPVQTPSITFPKKSQTKITLGYLSADFKNHSAASLIELLVEQHDRDKFKLVAFSDVQAPDQRTELFKQRFDLWYELKGLSDEEAKRSIQESQVDILVDMAGHTGVNRLSLLHQKMAPIQVSGLGLNYTTGLAAIDYFFADPYLAPPQEALHYSEKLIYLSSLMRWKPTGGDFFLEPCPVLKAGYITFGCGNNLFKLNQQVLKVWAEILQNLPFAKLHLKAKQFDDLELQQEFKTRFKSLGIGEAQLLFTGYSTRIAHMAFYSSLDIALDPFPFDGGVSTCEALYMGVPVITMGSAGRSILSQIKAWQWIAKSESEYIQLAVNLAQDLKALEQSRVSLRQDLLASPLCDEKGFVKEVEQAYEMMWRRYN